MIGGIALAVALVLVFPVLFLLSGAIGAFLLGSLLKDDGEKRHEGSELVDLYV
jgi:hypothetical protein